MREVEAVEWVRKGKSISGVLGNNDGDENNKYLLNVACDMCNV